MASREKEDFSSLLKYFKLANDLEMTSPVICYYIKTYAVTKGFEYFKLAKQKGEDTTDNQKLLDEWFKELEILKNQIGPQDKEKNKQDFLNFIYQLFLNCDNELREDRATIKTSQLFFNCSLLFDAYGLFGPLDSDIIQKSKK